MSAPKTSLLEHQKASHLEDPVKKFIFVRTNGPADAALESRGSHGAWAWSRTRSAAAAFMLAGSLLATDVFANLIVNPGNDLALVGGEIDGWTEVIGNNWARRSSNPVPQAGDAYFFAGAGAAAELAQTVDVSSLASMISTGTQEFAFSGYVRSFPQSPLDTSRIVLEYLDGAGTILDAFDSGALADSTQWLLVEDTRLAPTTTESIRVRLIADRNAGTNNDGYFDSLSLMAVTTSVNVPEPTTLGLLGLAVLGVSVARLRGRAAPGVPTT